MNPIRIAFSVSDKERSDFLKKTVNAESVLLDVVLPNGQTQSISAQNLFFDNEVNPQTATIPVYVDFPNNDHLLVPGNYVDVYVRFNDKEEVLLVPQVALIADVNGTYVLTVDENATVEQKYVTLGDVIEDKQIVLSGLNGDEQVIVQGLQKVRAGIQVNTTKVGQNTSGSDEK